MGSKVFESLSLMDRLSKHAPVVSCDYVQRLSLRYSIILLDLSMPGLDGTYAVGVRRKLTNSYLFKELELRCR